MDANIIYKELTVSIRSNSQRIGMMFRWGGRRCQWPSSIQSSHINAYICKYATRSTSSREWFTFSWWQYHRWDFSFSVMVQYTELFINTVVNRSRKSLESVCQISPNLKMEYGDYVILLLTTRHGFIIHELVETQIMLLESITMTFKGPFSPKSIWTQNTTLFILWIYESRIYSHECKQKSRFKLLSKHR